MQPLTQADIEYWASADYLRQQLLNARADAQKNGNKVLSTLLALAGLYSWDAARNVYLFNGKVVDPLQVKTAFQSYVNKKKTEVGNDALLYLRRQITLEQFTVRMRDNILNAHLNGAALASGGWGNVDDPQYRLLKEELLEGDPKRDKKGELVYLLLFLTGLAGLSIALDGRIVTRSASYIGASNVVYENLRREAAAALGVSTPESNAAAQAAQDAQWIAQTKEEIARKAEAAAKRAEAAAASAKATEAEKRAAQAARQAADDARVNADKANAESQEALNRAKEITPEGAIYERSIRHARDSCPGCIYEASRGWVPRGCLVPEGYRDCGGNCLCSSEYEFYSVLVAQGVI